MVPDYLRIADADRDDALARLSRGYAEGRLSDAELDTRTQAATQAVTVGDLRALLADLPAPAAVVPKARNKTKGAPKRKAQATRKLSAMRVHRLTYDEVETLKQGLLAATALTLTSCALLGLALWNGWVAFGVLVALVVAMLVTEPVR